MGQGPVFDRQTKVLGEVSLAPDLKPNDGLSTYDLRSINLLEGILTELKKIEYHLSIASDTELKDQDVD